MRGTHLDVRVARDFLERGVQCVGQARVAQRQRLLHARAAVERRAQRRLQRTHHLAPAAPAQRVVVRRRRIITTTLQRCKSCES